MPTASTKQKKKDAVPWQSTMPPFNSFDDQQQPDLLSASSTSSSHLHEQWEHVLKVQAVEGNYYYHATCQSFSSLENDSALREISDAFGSSVSTSSTSCPSFKNKRRRKKADCYNTNEKDTTATINRNDDTNSSHSYSDALDSERQSTDELLLIISSLEQDAIHDIRQAMHDASSMSRSSSCIVSSRSPSNEYGQQQQDKFEETGTPLHANTIRPTFENSPRSQTNCAAVVDHTIPPTQLQESLQTSISRPSQKEESLPFWSNSESSGSSPPPDFFPFDDDTISITDSYVLHSGPTLREKKERIPTPTTLDDYDEIFRNEIVDVEDCVVESEEDSTIFVLRQQVEHLNDLLDDMNSFHVDSDILDSPNEDGLQDELLRLEDCESMLKQELEAIDGLLAAEQQQRLSSIALQTTTGSADKVEETMLPLNFNVQEQGQTDNGNSREGNDSKLTELHISNQTQETATREQQQTVQIIPKQLVAHEHRMFPSPDDMKLLQERLQRDEKRKKLQQQKELRDKVPDFLKCHSSSEIFNVAAVGCLNLQKQQESHTWGPDTIFQRLERDEKRLQQRRQQQETMLEKIPDMLECHSCNEIVKVAVAGWSELQKLHESHNLGLDTSVQPLQERMQQVDKSKNQRREQQKQEKLQDNIPNLLECRNENVKVAVAGRSELQKLPGSHSWGQDTSIQPLQERQQQDEKLKRQQQPLDELQDNIPDLLECHSCNEIVKVAAAGWSELQKLQESHTWGPTTSMQPLQERMQQGVKTKLQQRQQENKEEIQDNIPDLLECHSWNRNVKVAAAGWPELQKLEENHPWGPATTMQPLEDRMQQDKTSKQQQQNQEEIQDNIPDLLECHSCDDIVNVATARCSSLQKLQGSHTWGPTTRMQPLEERMQPDEKCNQQRRHQQQQDSKEKIPDLLGCHSCNEIVKVATAGWSKVQKLQEIHAWGPDTSRDFNRRIRVNMDAPYKGHEYDGAEIDATTLVRVKKPIENIIYPDNSQKTILEEREDEGEDLDNVYERISDLIPARIFVPRLTPPSQRLPSLGNATLASSEISSSGTTIESGDYSASEGGDRLEELAAQSRVHNQVSLLAITTVARGLNNKSQPKKRIPMQATVFPNNFKSSSPTSAPPNPKSLDSNFFCSLSAQAPWTNTATWSPKTAESRKNTQDQKNLLFKEEGNKVPNTVIASPENRELYDSTDKQLVEKAGQDTTQHKNQNGAFKKVVLSKLRQSTVHRILAFEKTVLQNAQLPDRTPCDEAGREIEQTMSQCLKVNWTSRENFDGNLEIQSPLSMVSLADAALDEESSHRSLRLDDDNKDCKVSIEIRIPTFTETTVQEPLNNGKEDYVGVDIGPSSCFTDNKEDLRASLATATTKHSYLHAPLLGRMKNGYQKSPIGTIMNPFSRRATTNPCSPIGTLNDVAIGKTNKLLDRRRQKVISTFHEHFSDNSAIAEDPPHDDPKHTGEPTIQIDKRSNITYPPHPWIDDDVQSLSDSPLMALNEHPSFGQVEPPDFNKHSHRSFERSTNIRYTPFLNTPSDDKHNAGTNPFEDKFHDASEIETNPFDEPFQETTGGTSSSPFDELFTTNPLDNAYKIQQKCRRQSITKTMTTLSTLEQVNLDFELDLASEVEMLFISPETSPANQDRDDRMKPKGNAKTLEELTNTPKSNPSDESRKNFGEQVLAAPSDEGFDQADIRMPTSVKRAKRMYSNRLSGKRVCSTNSPPLDGGGNNSKRFSLLPVKAIKNVDRSRFEQKPSHATKKKKLLSAFMVGTSVRGRMSPTWGGAQKKYSVQPKDTAPSPIATLKSLPSIREEKSTESNDKSEPSKQELDRSGRSLEAVPTDERYNEDAGKNCTTFVLDHSHARTDVPEQQQEEEDREDAAIQETLCRIAARVQSSSLPGNCVCNAPDQEPPVTEQTRTGDLLYDCVDCICGDEDVNRIQRMHHTITNNVIGTGLSPSSRYHSEEVVTIDSRQPLANPSETSAGVLFSQSKSAEGKVRGIGIHVTCISHKTPSQPMREEGPSMGIELVYYDEDGITMASPTSKPTDEEGQSLDDCHKADVSRDATMDAVFRNDAEMTDNSRRGEEDTYGYSVDDGCSNQYHVIPESISFIDQPTMRTTHDVPLEKDANNLCNLGIAKAVSYHDARDTDRLLEEHPIQSSLWIKVQQCREKQKGDNTSTISNSSMDVHTGADRDPKGYCESIDSSAIDDKEDDEDDLVTSSAAGSPNTPATRDYDDVVQTLLTKTQQLLDAMLKFDYIAYAKLTTENITGIQLDGRFIQGRSFHSCYYIQGRKDATAIKGGKSKKAPKQHETTISFLDQVPLEQTVVSPTVRLLSSNVAIVSYKVHRKVLQHGRVVKSEIYETRVWEKRPGYHQLSGGAAASKESITRISASVTTTTFSGTATNQSIQVDDWVNCHFHVSGPASAGDDALATAPTIVDGRDRHESTHASSTTTTSSSVFYD